MKDPRLVQDYLRDILDAMDKAEEFIGGLDLHAFSRDDKTVQWVASLARPQAASCQPRKPEPGGSSIFHLI